MKKFLVHLLCLFIPKKTWRRNIRAKFLQDPLASVKLTLSEILNNMITWQKQYHQLEAKLTETENRLFLNQSVITENLKLQMHELDTNHTDISEKMKAEILSITANQLDISEKMKDEILTLATNQLDIAEKMKGEILNLVTNQSEIAEKMKFEILDTVCYRLIEIEKNQTILSENIKLGTEIQHILNCTNILARKLHPETFEKYRNVFSNKDVVLIATGPSLNHFKPIKDAIYVGVNRAFQYKKVKLDYLFAQDYSGLDYIDEMADYPAVKFYGILPDDWLGFKGENLLIPDSIAIRHGANRFIVNDVAYPKYKNYGLDDFNFAYELTSQPLTCYCSITFCAMQFILFGNPRRIYLVGCDTNKSGYFSGNHNSLNTEVASRGWINMQKFCKVHYPDTEIISINPIGLKGLFKDSFDKDFLLKMFNDKSYIQKFLHDNREERMDANREDIFHPDRTAFHKDRYEFAANYIQNKNVIDVASGLGYGADLMSRLGHPRKVTGIEINMEAAFYAEKIYGVPDKIEFLQGSILNLPFEDNTFDVFTSFETIEHVEDEARQIQEIKRVLKSDGLYIMSTPNDWDNTNNPYHVRDYNYASITKLINDNFELLEMFNQNSASKRGIIKTTDDNYKDAECFIIVARNKK